MKSLWNTGLYHRISHVQIFILLSPPIFSFFTIYFEMVSDLYKSCKNSTKNSILYYICLLYMLLVFLIFFFFFLRGISDTLLPQNTCSHSSPNSISLYNKLPKMNKFTMIDYYYLAYTFIQILLRFFKNQPSLRKTDWKSCMCVRAHTHTYK